MALIKTLIILAIVATVATAIPSGIHGTFSTRRFVNNSGDNLQKLGGGSGGSTGPSPGPSTGPYNRIYNGGFQQGPENFGHEEYPQEMGGFGHGPYHYEPY